MYNQSKCICIWFSWQIYMYRVVDNKGSAEPNSLAQPNLLCNPHNMAHTKQKRSKDPDLAKGSCGKHEISTIQPPGHQKDALTFQEKLTILNKMQKMKWTQKQTVSYYNNKGYGTRVSQTNMSHWLKDKEKMEAHVGDGGVNPATRHTCSVHHPELEAALTHWI